MIIDQPSWMNYFDINTLTDNNSNAISYLPCTAKLHGLTKQHGALVVSTDRLRRLTNCRIIIYYYYYGNANSNSNTNWEPNKCSKALHTKLFTQNNTVLEQYSKSTSQVKHVREQKRNLSAVYAKDVIEGMWGHIMTSNFQTNGHDSNILRDQRSHMITDMTTQTTTIF